MLIPPFLQVNTILHKGSGVGVKWLQYYNFEKEGDPINEYNYIVEGGSLKKRLRNIWTAFYVSLVISNFSETCGSLDIIVSVKKKMNILPNQTFTICW